MKVDFLMDFWRGTRGIDNSASLLAPLVRDFPDKITASFFRHLNTSRKINELLPNKLNEIFGVMHMKFLVFDNDILLTG